MTRSPRATRTLIAPLVALAMSVAVLTGCGATTFDESLAAPDTTAAVTTTTLPTGTAAELLPRLAAEAASLSGVMIDGGDDRSVVERMTALWTAVEREVGASRADLLAPFDANLALAQEAVQFDRAADADKASKNITALVDAYLSA